MLIRQPETMCSRVTPFSFATPLRSAGCLCIPMRLMPRPRRFNILRNLRLQGGDAVKLGFIAQFVQKGYLDALAV